MIMLPRASASTSVASLVKQLAAKVGRPRSLSEPFILEDRIPQTRSRHVVVIWDAWGNLARADRSKIILDAFQTANHLNGDTVRVALGLTQQEAFDLGYLPFQIVATIRETDRVKRDNVRKALESVGGIHVKVGNSHQLRFPSQEYAEDAYRQLAAKIHGPYWAITQEVAPIGHA
jgi:hypothetical protein